MNIDELLTDNVPPSSSQSAPGGGAEGSKAGASVNIKKLNGEIEMTKARLSDQKFKISKSTGSSDRGVGISALR